LYPPPSLPRSGGGGAVHSFSARTLHSLVSGIRACPREHGSREDAGGDKAPDITASALSRRERAQSKELDLQLQSLPRVPRDRGGRDDPRPALVTDRARARFRREGSTFRGEQRSGRAQVGATRDARNLARQTRAGGGCARVGGKMPDRRDSWRSASAGRRRAEAHRAATRVPGQHEVEPLATRRSTRGGPGGSATTDPELAQARGRWPGMKSSVPFGRRPT